MLFMKFDKNKLCGFTKDVIWKCWQTTDERTDGHISATCLNYKLNDEPSDQLSLKPNKTSATSDLDKVLNSFWQSVKHWIKDCNSDRKRVFLCPRDDSQGALRFAPVCPSDCLSVRLSVRPSVRHALWYRVCVINSSHSFLWIFLKPCIPLVDILKMCMWVFGGAKNNFDRITAFRT